MGGGNYLTDSHSKVETTDLAEGLWSWSNEMFRCISIHKFIVFLLVAAALPLLAVCDTALADNIRPAYLDIEEFKPGALRVVWKVPLNQNLPARFRPSFPKSFKVSSPIKRVKTSNAVIKKWTMLCGTGKLAGATIGIEGLEETTTDALVRVQLADGSLHRAVLRPTERSTMVPASESTVSQQEGGVPSVLRLVGRWWYVLLFLVAWLLSLAPGARRRGIILCTLALVAGSLFGHALGGFPIHDKLFGPKMLSEVETKRILRGLMLNTYRAFILDKDEEIYDVLARSVDGEFLSEVYLQNKEALRIDATDGALSIVDRLDVKSIESMKRLKNGAIAIVANWDVYGSVRHWNHIHFRCNTYKAELTIVPANNYWKLTRVQLLDEERVI